MFSYVKKCNMIKIRFFQVRITLLWERVHFSMSIWSRHMAYCVKPPLGILTTHVRCLGLNPGFSVSWIQCALETSEDGSRFWITVTQVTEPEAVFTSWFSWFQLGPSLGVQSVWWVSLSRWKLSHLLINTIKYPITFIATKSVTIKHWPALDLLTNTSTTTQTFFK